MSGWSDGYVTDRDYTRSFQQEMAPAHLRCLLLLRQRMLPDLSRPFRYLDLGCGSGLTATLLAAANPTGEFIGVDFSPDHIVQARALAAAARIENVSFIEASFADLLGESPAIGDVDFLGCHGVYSWVTADNQRRIVELMRRHVMPGGVVYIGYNAMPGWAPLAPVRHLISRLAKNRPEAHAEDAIEEARTFLAEMQTHGAGYMAGNTPVSRWLERVGDQPRSYLAHEYLPEASAAVWHDVVARDLSAARLRYVGSARLVENFDSINVPGPLRQTVAAAEEQGLGEIMRDLVVNQTFRMDVFARGAPRASPAEAEAAFAELPVALAEPPPSRPTIRAAHGEVPLAEQIAVPVLEIIAAGPATVGDIIARAEAHGVDRRRARQALTAIIAGGKALPLAELCPRAEAVAACRRFNHVALSQTLGGRTIGWLASPKLGGGLAVGLPEQRILAGGGQGGSPESEPPDHQKRLERFEDRLPFLQKLGIVQEEY